MHCIHGSVRNEFFACVRSQSSTDERAVLGGNGAKNVWVWMIPIATWILANRSSCRDSELKLTMPSDSTRVISIFGL